MNNRVRVFALIALTGAAAAVLSGCRITSAATVVEKRGAVYSVRVNSLMLDNHLQVLERSTRLTNGLLDAQIRVQNVTARDVQFEYLFLWLDGDGIQLDTSTTVWTPLALHAKAEGFLRGMAPSPEAVDFQMRIRFVHPSMRW